MDINADVNHLLYKDYDLDEAIKVVTSNRKGFLHKLFYELRSSDADNNQDTSQLEGSTDTESLTDSVEVDDSEDSQTENKKILKSYRDIIITNLVNESGDRYNFVNEVAQLVREYKAVRQSVMFEKLLTTMKRLMRRGYDVHDAINKAVKKRRFLVTGVYDDEINKREAEKKMASYNNTITNYA